MPTRRCRHRRREFTKCAGWVWNLVTRRDASSGKNVLSGRNEAWPERLLAPVLVSPRATP
jgi:hypothetical protein